MYICVYIYIYIYIKTYDWGAPNRGPLKIPTRRSLSPRRHRRREARLQLAMCSVRHTQSMRMIRLD